MRQKSTTAVENQVQRKRLLPLVGLGMVLVVVCSVQDLVLHAKQRPRSRDELNVPAADQRTNLALLGGEKNDKAPASKTDTKKARASAKGEWPLFRGNAASDGVATSALPDKLEVVWKKSFKNGIFEATAAIVNGLVYVGSLDGDLYALDLKSGQEKWKFHTELGFKAAAAVSEEMVFVGDTDGVFHALDAATGEEKWSIATGAEINAGANFYGDNVLFGSQDGSLYCLQKSDGKQVWKYTIDNMIQCSPTIVENRGLLAGCDGQLHVVDLDSGERVVTLDIQDPTGSTAAASGDSVYFGTQGGKFFSTNWREAKVNWIYDRLTNPIQSAAAVAQGIVVFGSRERRMPFHALDAATGKERWTFPAKSRIDSSPVIVGDRVIFGAGNGVLHALDLKTGVAKWEYELGGAIVASPAVGEERLVIGNDAGDLYCFGAK